MVRRRGPSEATIIKRARAKHEAERIARTLVRDDGTVALDTLLSLIAECGRARIKHVALVDGLGLASYVSLSTLRRLRRSRRYLKQSAAVVTLDPRCIIIRWNTGRLRLCGAVPSHHEAREALTVEVGTDELPRAANDA
jgi:hypothetical protein